MLARNPLLDYTENDYTCIIWFKLFKKMFPPGNNMRIKSGESIFDVSTSKKKELYPESKYVRGFKIDIRFVVDVGEKEVDLAAAEIAKDESKYKTIMDQGKLVREGKDIVDNLVDIALILSFPFFLFFFFFLSLEKVFIPSCTYITDLGNSAQLDATCSFTIKLLKKMSKK